MVDQGNVQELTGPSGEKRIAFTTFITPERYRILHRIAEQQEMTLADVVNEAFGDYIARALQDRLYR